MLPVEPSSLAALVTEHIPDSQVPPAQGIVDLRVGEIMDAATLPPYTPDAAGLELRQSIREAVETAYRAGLRDGLVRLGDLIQ